MVNWHKTCSFQPDSPQNTSESSKIVLSIDGAAVVSLAIASVALHSTAPPELTSLLHQPTWPVKPAKAKQ